jgi:hypothetical protein
MEYFMAVYRRKGACFFLRIFLTQHIIAPMQIGAYRPADRMEVFGAFPDFGRAPLLATFVFLR